MEHSSRYLIGIDLGTTNSVLAYLDTEDSTSEDSAGIRVFQIPQLVMPGEVQALPALPSFLYFPTQDELTTGAVAATWDENPPMVTGVLAREQGALVPGRQVTSAKSWLSNAAVDRRAAILPWQAEPPQPRISPVETSARYLMHLRDAWNRAFGSDPAKLFKNQEIVLTVPASFDEEARELTLEAARRAGLEHLTMLEEPLAAFYSWIVENRKRLAEELRDGDLVLICDIGGGTTDFSLVRARIDGGEVQFERTAIGEHLLLGGDNLDLALARRVEERLGGSKLSMRQRQGLRRAVSSAKEQLLSDDNINRVPIAILGGGRSVVGQMLNSELTRDEVLEVLTGGFLPIIGPHELPVRSRAAGLRELGLPYASDPAITKHLAAFLTQAAVAMSSDVNTADARGDHLKMVCPDAVLFNGGFCAPAITRQRIVEAIAGWFQDSRQGWRPRVLESGALHSAVALGAAHYGRVRRGQGLRIRAGSPRTYYIGLRSDQRAQGVCVLPAGVEEGTTLALASRDFDVLANRPVSFTLYSSKTRHDAHGEVAELNDGDIHRHAPLVTVLRYGKKMREIELAVRLRITFTEVGTLELWCESLTSPHRWRLQFELRGDEGQADDQSVSSHAVASHLARPQQIIDQTLDTAVRLIRTVFENAGGASTAEPTGPDALVSKLESILGVKKDGWPIAVTRRLGDALIEVAGGRRKTPRHEVRWLNLLGFCLRPGFGAPGDELRARQVRNIQLTGPAFPEDLQCQVEWLILLRRLAGGLNASEQRELYRQQSAVLSSVGKRRGKRLNSQIEHEGWRLLATLEHLPATLRAGAGSELLARTVKNQSDRRWLWPLARLGARIPLYGPLSCVVTAEVVAEWLKALLELPDITAEGAYAVVQLGRRTSDPRRDIDDVLREHAIERLTAAGIEGDSIQVLRKYVPPGRGDAARMFGESLPKGLQLVSSADCLLSITALTPDPERVA